MQSLGKVHFDVPDTEVAIHKREQHIDGERADESESCDQSPQLYTLEKLFKVHEEGVGPKHLERDQSGVN